MLRRRTRMSETRGLFHGGTRPTIIAPERSLFWIETHVPPPGRPAQVCHPNPSGSCGISPPSRRNAPKHENV